VQAHGLIESLPVLILVLLGAELQPEILRLLLRPHDRGNEKQANSDRQCHRRAH
jgi:hypothetical protein